MLHFLRTIRRTLIESLFAQPADNRQKQNKHGRQSSPAGKYFLYALGEIALVVTGILIALQINNWNEKKNENAQIKTYLNSLIEAIQSDIDYLEFTQTGNTFRTVCLSHLLHLATGETPLSIPPIKDDLVGNYEYSRPKMEWHNIWKGPMPESFSQEFTQLCFEYSSYGNIIVVNESTLEEFKNTGLFSFIDNKELKTKINEYYANMNWNFSDWREANYRAEIDQWEHFLRDKYQVNTTDISGISDPLKLIKDHRDLQLEMEEIAIDASQRANSAGDLRQEAMGLKTLIQSEISKM